MAGTAVGAMVGRDIGMAGGAMLIAVGTVTPALAAMAMLRIITTEHRTTTIAVFVVAGVSAGAGSTVAIAAIGAEGFVVSEVVASEAYDVADFVVPDFAVVDSVAADSEVFDVADSDVADSEVAAAGDPAASA